ncbi:MAG: Uma2 family endonuclease [Deltaproteobacteria bacterium]|nr:Uma2 family endonuclease [Myxococcales bacterium]MDP3219193.1 Uma2 family endonuclease [Deltaproteobacteria bacterium]
MHPTTARLMHWSEQEYLAMEAGSPIKHEFLSGEVFAMAGATPAHNRAAASMLVALGLLTRGRPCRVFNSDQRIYVVEGGLYTYPDGGVACGPWQIHADGMSLLNPVLLYEVLSTSTRDYDRGAKAEHYRQIPSLRHLLLVDQPDRCIEHHRRAADGTWSLITVRSGALDLADLGGGLSLDDVYLPEIP